jgi:hypothetical protein
MSGFFGPSFLAVSGTTGNIAGTAAANQVRTNPTASKIAVVYVAEVAGTTATWKVQGSMDLPEVSDTNSNWFDMPYVLPTTDTLAVAAITRTTLGADVIWLAQPQVRFVRKLRLVVTANTGQTFRCEVHQQSIN